MSIKKGCYIALVHKLNVKTFMNYRYICIACLAIKMDWILAVADIIPFLLQPSPGVDNQQTYE